MNNCKAAYFNPKHLYIFYLVIAVTIGFYCYRQTLSSYFYADDYLWIADSKTAALNFFDTFNISKTRVRPFGFVPHLIYSWLLKAGKWSPAPFYFFIIALRIITSFLLFILSYRCFKKPLIAFFISLVFLVNFSTWETVYWLVTFVYSIGLFFYALTLIVFLSDLKRNGIIKLISLFMIYLAGIFTHENAVTLLPICLVTFLAYGPKESAYFRINIIKALAAFFKRYSPLFFITVIFSALRCPGYEKLLISFSYLLKTAVSIIKSSLLWFIPEGILNRLIILCNKLFHANSTLDIQSNLFLLIISVFITILFFSFSIWALIYFFTKKDRSCAVLMLVGLLVMVFNIFVAAAHCDYGGIFVPSRLLYYPSFGFSLVLAGLAVFFVMRLKHTIMVNCVFFAGFLAYVLAATTVNKKIGSSVCYDTNIYRVLSTGIENRIPVFTPDSLIYADISSVKFKVTHSSLYQLEELVKELLNQKPPFTKPSFVLKFTEQNIKNEVAQGLTKQVKPRPTFYFEVKGDTLITYRWSPGEKVFIIENNSN